MELTELSTERLILTNFKESFLSDFNEYASVEGVGECAGWPHHKSIQESKSILADFIKEGNNYAVVYKENHKLIGSIGLNDSKLIHSPEVEKRFPLKRVIEIGYVLSKDYWGKGLMTEAVKEIIKDIFTKNKYDVIIISHLILINVQIELSLNAGSTTGLQSLLIRFLYLENNMII